MTLQEKTDVAEDEPFVEPAHFMPSVLVPPYPRASLGTISRSEADQVL